MGSNRKRTTTEFIAEASIVHDNKFDYSKVEYLTNKGKVVIICPEHGEFKQEASSHLKGFGCAKCSGLKRLTTTEFISKAINVHNGFYDYSKVVYVGGHKPVGIICPKHGMFQQTPANHLQGQTCRECFINSQKKCTKEFITEMTKLHDNKYDYSLVDYVNRNTKIIIICPEHGEFEQTPNGHMKGYGCSRCNTSHGENAIHKILMDSNISFSQQHTFDNCRNINQLPFDFYLPELNICIEYDGQQHYKPINFFGGEKTFRDIKKRDTIKTNYCNDNNITLLRVRYDEDISSKLQPILSDE